MTWALKDKDGLFRSRRAFKSDCKQDSNEEWELRRQNKKIQNENDVARYPLNFKLDKKMFMATLEQSKKPLPKKWDHLK